jgi:FkbM family methyltransferase
VKNNLAIKQILGLYEKKIRNILKSLHGDCFYDVGANIGFYSLLLSHNFRQVYAVEPVPINIRRLKRRLSVRLVRNVRVVPVALSNTNGKATFYINSDSRGIIDNLTTSSLFETFEFRSCDHASDITYTGSPISVQTMTFDSLLSEPVADLVKIDVEGAEFLVLEGMRESMAKRRVRNILVELHDRDRRSELEDILKTNFDRVFSVGHQHLYACDDEVSSIPRNPGNVLSIGSLLHLFS